jgi:hypothetical protein
MKYISSNEKENKVGGEFIARDFMIFLTRIFFHLLFKAQLVGVVAAAVIQLEYVLA